MPHLALPLNAYDASTRYGASWSSQSRWQWGGTWHPVSRSILERHRDNLEYIHVKLVDFGQLHNNVHPLQVAIFPLDRSGAFDMGKVQRAWGLRHCSVINPARGTIYEPPNPGRLESTMVRLLSDNYGYLTVCDPTCGKQPVVSESKWAKLVSWMVLTQVYCSLKAVSPFLFGAVLLWTLSSVDNSLVRINKSVSELLRLSRTSA